MNYMLHIPITQHRWKPKYKLSMAAMLALARQIILWIEELQTFNMVLCIDLRHLAL